MDMFGNFRKTMAVVMSLNLAVVQQVAWALPTGETVVSGTASFLTTPTTMTVNQTTDKAIINYNTFSIAGNEGVTFVQPSTTSVALNRVVGVDASTILGSLSSNGRIFLVNPNGVVFGADANVDTAGMIASTLGISDADFLAGNYNFIGSGGTVQNLGVLNAPGGFIALLGTHVDNSGVIAANTGEIVLASGNAITVSLDPAGIVSVAVTGDATSNAGADDAVINNGVIRANNGMVLLTAKSINGLFDNAINNQGLIEASGLGVTDGIVNLQASGADTVIDGNINAGKVISNNTTSDTTISGHLDVDAIGVEVDSAGDITHNYQSTVQLTNGASFRGNAGGDYIVKNGSLIESDTGTIDIYATQNVIIGSNSEASDEYAYDWNYIGGERKGKFMELGYYTNDGVFVPVYLAVGADIGKDGVTVSSGSGFLGSDLPDGLFGKYLTSAGTNTWYTDTALNSDGAVHYNQVGNVYFVEDKPALSADFDYQDEIFRFDVDTVSYTGAPAIRTGGNLFITAQNGYIHENKADISSNNLIMNAETGITGHGSNGGFVADTNYLAAYNGTSGELKFEDPDDVVISDLSSLTGLNSGVNGLNGVTNDGQGSPTDIVAGNDLMVAAQVTTHGHINLEAGHDIVQTKGGHIEIIQVANDPFGPPINVESTSHVINTFSANQTIDVQWQLPLADVDAYDFTADAGNDYVMEGDATIKTHGGDASIVADQDVYLTLVDANLGAVDVTAQNGDIIDQDKDVAPSDFDVIARQINLSAPNGVVGGASPDEIDLGAPYTFSYVWDQIPGGGIPDMTTDAYTAELNALGEWVFKTSFTAPVDTYFWWFHVATLDEAYNSGAGRLSSAVNLGPFLIPPGGPTPSSGAPDAFGEFEQLYPAYYEILDPNKVSSFEAIQPIGFYAYHPIAETLDQTPSGADIELEEGAFDFIEEQLKKKK